VEGVLKQPNGETDMTEAHKEDDRDDDQYNDENDKSAKDDKEPKSSKNDVSSVAEPEKKEGESVPLLPLGNETVSSMVFGSLHALMEAETVASLGVIILPGAFGRTDVQENQFLVTTDVAVAAGGVELSLSATVAGVAGVQDALVQEDTDVDQRGSPAFLLCTGSTVRMVLGLLPCILSLLAIQFI
jgi:hypothetical protein